MKNGFRGTLLIAVLCLTLSGCMFGCPVHHACCHGVGPVCARGCGHAYADACDGGQLVLPPSPRTDQKSQRPDVPKQEKPPRPPPLKQGYRQPSLTDLYGQEYSLAR